MPGNFAEASGTASRKLFRYLAKNLEVADNAVLQKPVSGKIFGGFARHVGLNLANRIEHMRQVFARPHCVCAHTGKASASTFSRKVEGRNFGVRISTLIPTLASSSI